MTAELVAVVDLGSTAVRLPLARIQPGTGYRVLVEERVATRLGGGTPRTLPARAIADTLRAVRRFLARYTAKRRGPRVVAVATSAVRDAANRERLLGPLRRREGVDVQVLSARDPGERKHRHGLELRQSDVTAIRERLEELTRRKRGKIRGLKAERADIVLAGAIAIEEVMVFGGYLTLVVCSIGVRDGVLLRETFGNGRAT